MRLRLIKSWENNVRKFPIGSVIRVQDTFGKRLIEKGIGIAYNGKLPPKKMKCEIFKPK